MFEVNGTSLIVFGSFAVYMSVMHRIFFKPVFEVVTERQNVINGALQASEHALVEQKRITDDCESKLRAGRDAAQKTIQVVVDAAREHASNVKNTARQEAATQVASGVQQLDEASQNCYNALKSQQDDFVRLIVDKVSKAGERSASLVS